MTKENLESESHKPHPGMALNQLVKRGNDDWRDLEASPDYAEVIIRYRGADFQVKCEQINARPSRTHP